MLEQRDRLIVSQTAYECAAWIHAAEVQGGAEPDLEHLFALARQVANGMIKLAGSPSAGQAGGVSPRVEGSSPRSPSAPSCPKCDAPLEQNKDWTGLGNQPGHKKTESIKWRCSQRGRFVKGSGWEGCDGVRWQDAIHPAEAQYGELG